MHQNCASPFTSALSLQTQESQGSLQWESASLSFLSLYFLEKGKENHQKTRICITTEPLKSLEKEGENAQKNKEFLAGGKNKEFQKKKERKDRFVTMGFTPEGLLPLFFFKKGLVEVDFDA